MKIPCPACGKKKHQDRPGGMKKCNGCGGLFDPAEIESGDIEGGTYSNDPSRRMQQQESGYIDEGSPVVNRRTDLIGGGGGSGLFIRAVRKWERAETDP